MQRIDIIEEVGSEYCTSNIEKGEFSYPKAFKEKGIEFKPIEKKKSLPFITIKLPATSDGEPDWQWMENYIKSLPYGDRLPVDE